MRATCLVVAVIVAASPVATYADRGALTLEVSPALTWWPSMQPAVGTGSGVSGTAGGGLVGLRCAVRNELELTASGFYEAPADFTTPRSTVGTTAGPITGTLAARTGRWGALVGARWVQGLVWRWFVGGEIGWAQQTSTRLDLIDVSDPGNAHSFGLGLSDRSRGSLVISPLAGVERQFRDHWSLLVAPRVQFLLGGTGRVAIVMPVSVGYSWYGL